MKREEKNVRPAAATAAAALTAVLSELDSIATFRKGKTQREQH